MCTLRALEGIWRILERGRSIVVGDFNDNGRWDTPRQTSFKDTVELLRSIGYVSLYHARTGESHGDESAASLYWYRHRDRPYLVDHAFVPEVWLPFVRSFELGDPAPEVEWSDHQAASHRARCPRRTWRRWSCYPRHHRRIRPLIPAWRDLPMTNDRDSSGGYLTGDESERLWDEEEEDAFVSAQVDYDDEGDDPYPSLEGPIESVWARALAVAAEIVAINQAIDRVQGLTTFDPNDPPIEELETRSDTLADERSELEYQMAHARLPAQELVTMTGRATPTGASPVGPRPIQATPRHGRSCVRI